MSLKVLQIILFNILSKTDELEIISDLISFNHNQESIHHSPSLK